MATTPTIGLEAVLDMKGFSKNADDYSKQVGGMTGQTEKSAGAMGKAFSTIGKVAVVGTAAAIGALAAVGGAVIKLAADARQIPLVSSAFEKLGGSIERMREGSAGMITDVELMKAFNSAAALVSKDFAERLPDAMGILRKVAAATGEDMGYLLDSLVKGVGRVSPAILDNLKVQVTLTEAAEEWAKSQGDSAKSVINNADKIGELSGKIEMAEAQYRKMNEQLQAGNKNWTETDVALKQLQLQKKAEDIAAMKNQVSGLSAANGTLVLDTEALIESMTKEQQQQAIMDLTMKKLNETYGDTDDVIGSAMQQQAAFKTTITNLKNEIGVAFLPVYNTMLGALGSLAEKYGPMVLGWAQEFGSWMTTKLVPAIGSVIGFISDLASEISGLISWTIEQGGNLEMVLRNLLSLGLEKLGLDESQIEAVFDVINRLQGAIEEVVRWFSEQLIPAIQTTSVWLGETLAPTIEAVGTWITTSLVPALTAAWEWLGVKIPEAVQAAGEWITSSLVPALIDIWEWLGVKVPEAVQTVSAWITDTLIPALRNTWEFVQTNVIPILSGLATTVGTLLVGAFIAWATTAIPAAIAALVTFATVTIPAAVAGAIALVTAMGPIIVVAAAVGVAVGLLVAAWMNDWGGVRTFMTDLWNNTLSPIFETIKSWFEVKIPAAIKTVSGFWENTLLPPIQAVGAFISDKLIPTFQAIGDWLSTKVPAAINATSNAWASFIAPIQTATAWINTNLVPLLKAIGEVYLAVMGLALQAVAGLWQNVFMPAIKTVGDFIKNTLSPEIKELQEQRIAKLQEVSEKIAAFWTNTLEPAFRAVGDFLKANLLPILKDVAELYFAGIIAASEEIAAFWNNTLKPALEAVWLVLKDNLGPILKAMAETYFAPLISAVDRAKTSFNNIGATIKSVTGFFSTLANAVKNFKLPKVLTPGSPTPFEQGLTGIGHALESVTREMVAFANSITYEQAKQFEKVSDAIEDLAQAFLMFADVSIKLPEINRVKDWAAQFVAIGQVLIEAVAGIGYVESYIRKMKSNAVRIGDMMQAMIVDMSDIKIYPLPDLRAWGQQVFDVAMNIIRVVQEVKDYLGSSRAVDLMAELAGKINEILALKDVDFSKMTIAEHLPDLNTWSDQVLQVGMTIVNTIIELDRQLGGTALESAAGMADSAGKIMDFVDKGTGAIKSMADYGEVETRDVVAKMGNFAANVWEIARSLINMSQDMELEATQAAAEILKAAQDILGFVKPAIEALAALADVTAIEDVAGKMDIIQRDVGARIIRSLMELADGFNLDGVQAAALILQSAESIVGFVGPAIEALVALADMPAVGDLRVKMDWLYVQAQAVVDRLDDLGTYWAEDGLDISAGILTSAKSIIGFIKPAIEGLVALGDLPAIPNLAKVMELLRVQANLVVEKLDIMADRWADDGLDASALILSSAQGMIGFIKPAVEALVALGDVPAIHNLAKVMELLRVQADLVVTKLDAMADDWAEAGLDAAASILASAQSMFTFINSALDTLARIEAYKGETIEAQIGKLSENMQKVATWIVAQGQALRDAVPQASAFATACGDVSELIGEGLSILMAVKPSDPDWTSSLAGSIESALRSAQGVIRDQLNQIRAIFDELSPEMRNTAYDYGRQVGAQIARGIQDQLDSSTITVSPATTTSSSSSQAGDSISNTPGGPVVNLNMGGQTINNGMDTAVFSSLVRREVARAMRMGT